MLTLSPQSSKKARTPDNHDWANTTIAIITLSYQRRTWDAIHEVMSAKTPCGVMRSILHGWKTSDRHGCGTWSHLIRGVWGGGMVQKWNGWDRQKTHDPYPYPNPPKVLICKKSASHLDGHKKPSLYQKRAYVFESLGDSLDGLRNFCHSLVFFWASLCAAPKSASYVFLSRIYEPDDGRISHLDCGGCSI
jgi:hypothetical protein